MTEQVRSQWKTIWNKDRILSFDLEGHTSTEIFSELKRIDGFDIQNIPVDGFIKQHDEILSGLKSHGSIKSVFDLGCGSGANLFLFKQEGYKIGGMDYSKPLIEVAKTVLGKDIELICGEANLLPTDIHYDALVANSVFSYFPSLDYAREVLDRMAKKSENMVIVDIHEFGKEEAFTEYRRCIDPDYDNRYKDLKKLFYDPSFFEEWAKDNRFEVEIGHPKVEGYWNNDFVFTVSMWKEE